MNLTRLDEHGKLAYGRGLANSLAYMMSGFRGWELFGLVKDDPKWSIGVEVDKQGATTNAVSMCALYGKPNEPTIQSEDRVQEQEQIDAGKTAIIIFRGIDDISWMRRMTPEEYVRTTILEFKKQPTDLVYN